MHVVHNALLLRHLHFDCNSSVTILGRYSLYGEGGVPLRSRVRLFDVFSSEQNKWLKFRIFKGTITTTLWSFNQTNKSIFQILNDRMNDWTGFQNCQTIERMSKIVRKSLNKRLSKTDFKRNSNMVHGKIYYGVIASHCKRIPVSFDQSSNGTSARRSNSRNVIIERFFVMFEFKQCSSSSDLLINRAKNLTESFEHLSRA